MLFLKQGFGIKETCFIMGMKPLKLEVNGGAV
jgi:hypothetical protein